MKLHKLIGLWLKEKKFSFQEAHTCPAILARGYWITNKFYLWTPSHEEPVAFISPHPDGKQTYERFNLRDPKFFIKLEKRLIELKETE
jgi:hypothetical protein